MTLSKPAHKSKTLWINFLIFLGGLFTLAADLPIVKEYPKIGLALTMIVIPAINSVLRFVTDTAVSITGKQRRRRG